MLLHDMFLGLIGGIGAQELIIILLIVVVLFGARKIPDLARGLGRGITEFKKGLRDEPDQPEGGDKRLEEKNHKAEPGS